MCLLRITPSTSVWIFCKLWVGLNVILTTSWIDLAQFKFLQSRRRGLKLVITYSMQRCTNYSSEVWPGIILRHSMLLHRRKQRYGHKDMRGINRVSFGGLLNLQLKQVYCEGGQWNLHEKNTSMITLESREKIMLIMKGLFNQWGIPFGAQARTFVTCSNLLAEKFCDLCPPCNMN